MPPTTYTHGHHESVLRAHRWRTAGNSAGYLLPHLRAGMSLLDVGCGPGTLTADLAAAVFPGRVTAVERAPAAAGLARAEARQRNQPNVGVALADAHRLPFPAGAFDAVHAHQVLQHLADPVQALRQMRRVCAPGGIVAVRDSDYAAFAWYPPVPELTEWLALYRRVARANGGEPDAGRRLLRWARAAGFDQIAAGSSTWCFATPQDRAWWGGLWADRVLASDFARHALAAGAAEADLHRLAAGWRSWAAAGDGWFSLLHGELVCRR
jgi:SAM-dependent methyltransferase